MLCMRMQGSLEFHLSFQHKNTGGRSIFTAAEIAPRNSMTVMSRIFDLYHSIAIHANVHSSTDGFVALYLYRTPQWWMV